MQEQLLILREKKGLSKTDIAKILKIHPKTYALKEAGKVEFTMNEMFELSMFFGLKIEDIFLPINTPKWSKIRDDNSQIDVSISNDETSKEFIIDKDGLSIKEKKKD